ncbi:MAG: 50S ribosomal protein L32 [Candidatus Margulisbacteria bacterium]|nr:50S ribosomal protein L32 [Candidatus Margulisiibacteriota bacterium]MBU1021883.1 50S ribosomal protein L32 [Candidatus Margulisiibacteriota bacterium]MBU1728521.1 50S ribosomal protein L32 [Candidatus Margulisiibacteriota bacterium]MBU1954668.1 50S ribosomal protein L32 [Candidatus Margulisiibacteriota bacterium]
MVQPKKKHSSSRQWKRRANWKIKAKGMTKCTKCGAPVLPHYACAACGNYRGREMIKIKAAKGKKEKK